MNSDKPIVYTCFCTDVIHDGHLNLINEAKKYGDVVIGVLCDSEMVKYNKFPLKSTEERVKLVESISGVKQVIVQDKIMYDGELNICFLLTGDNSVGINTINTKIPFNATVNMQDVDNNSIIDTQIDVKNQSFVVNNSTIDANIDLEVTTNMCNTEEVNIIENITSEETECVPSCSMVIYFVKPGDTLWKIAKQYRSTVEDIVRINQIQNPDKIDVGMQLFIPKYCCKRQMSA